MRIEFKEAKYEKDSLVLKTNDNAFRRFLYNFEPGVYEITPARKKRSLDANSYCWELCTQIAKAVGVTKEEVYRKNIREGNEYAQVRMHTDAVSDFQRVWATRGTGWFLEVVDDALLSDHKEVFAYYGSSVYDTKQMSSLLDRIVQDAKNIGLETLSEREKSLLLDEWDEQKKKGTGAKVCRTE